MRAPSLRPRFLWLSTLALALSACSRPEARAGEAPPPLESMDTVGVIVGSDEFWPSGLVEVAPCKLWVVGDSWGTLVELDFGEGTERTVGRVTWRSRVRLAAGAPGEVVAWSVSSGWAMRVDVETARTTGLALPSHPWTGVPASGPLTAVSGHRLVMAPLGTWSSVRSPRPWIDAPEVVVLDSLGAFVSGFGHVTDRGAVYLSSFGATATVGAIGDTVLLANLFDATLSRHVIEEG